MLKLNLGCGNDIRDGYVNIDLRKTHKCVVIASITDLPYGTEEVDEIRAIDVLEHVGWRLTEDVLVYWIRLLKKGGRLEVITPDFVALCEKTLANKTVQNQKLMISRMFGGQDYPENTHLAGLTQEMYEDIFKRNGMIFESVKRHVGNGTNIHVIGKKS